MSTSDREVLVTETQERKRSWVLFIPRTTCGRIVGAVVLLMVAGCAHSDRQGTADELARQGHLHRDLLRVDPFVLTVYSRLTRPGYPLTVYIEGDGLAWLDVARISPDPTPRHPLGLALAARDPSENVLYLARPCQYTEPRLNPQCTAAYWTDRRFSEEVVAAMNAAIDLTKRDMPGARVNLIGYSGGGAIATLIAARRADVATLRTVAGNLDHKAVNTFHHVDQQVGSLNAIDVADRLASLPQRHFVGMRDTVVPPTIAASFAGRVGDGRCVEVISVEGATHADGWVERWEGLLAEPMICRQLPLHR